MGKQRAGRQRKGPKAAPGLRAAAQAYRLAWYGLLPPPCLNRFTRKDHRLAMPLRPVASFVKAGRFSEALAQLRAVLGLGLPLVGSHLAQFALHITDTVMLGWYGALDLAGAALGVTVFFACFTLGSGFGQAVMPLAAAASAAGNPLEARRALRMGIWLSMAYSLGALPLFLFAAPLLSLLRQDPAVVPIASAYLAIVGFGLAPALLVMTLKSFLAALGRTQVVFWVTLGAVFLNALCNWVLIFGRFGAPELGAQGAAFASVLVQLATLALLVAYVVFLPALRPFGLLSRLWRRDRAALSRVFRLGLPIGLAMLCETGLFAASALMMGWLGPLSLAAHAIALEIVSAFFMVHLGLSNAATVLVGQARGRGDRAGLTAAAGAAVMVSLLFALATAVVFVLFGAPLAGLFLAPDEPTRGAIVALAGTLLAVAALFQLADASQVMAMGLLRGLEDTRTPMLIAAAAYWAVGVPISFFLAFGFGFGAVGIWLGLVVGLSTAAVLLMIRFWRALATGVPRAQLL